MSLKKDDQKIDDLILGYLNGNLSSVETNELIAWVKQDKSHKRYFDEFSEIWITSKATGDDSKFNYQKGFLNFKNQIYKDRRFIGLLPYRYVSSIRKIAAIFIIAFSLGGILFFNIGRHQGNLSKQGYSEIVVPRGARAQFILNDGTKVTLNAGSKLRYNNRFGIADRRVELEGEAYFEVAKDKSKQFIVSTSNIEVTALGTKFNVKAYPTDKTIETTLIQGSVMVENKSKLKESKPVMLLPNQKLTYYKDEALMTKESTNKTDKENNRQTAAPQKLSAMHRFVAENVNVIPVISWKENRWIIEKQTLANLAVDMERKFDIHIHFGSERLKNFRFTGTLLDESLEQVLQVMSFSAPINFRVKGKDVFFTEKDDFDEIYRKLYSDQ